jgi:hypothetical protein
MIQRAVGWSSSVMALTIEGTPKIGRSRNHGDDRPSEGRDDSVDAVRNFREIYR